MCRRLFNQESLLVVTMLTLCLKFGETQDGGRHPWGVKLCNGRCLRTWGCSGFGFSVLKLECFITDISPPNTLWFIRTERQGDGILPVKNSTCSTHSIMLESKMRGTICLHEVQKNRSSAQTSLTTESSCLRVREGNHAKNKCGKKLKRAMWKNSTDEVKNLLSRGLEDVDCDFLIGKTPVMWAASHGKGRLFDCLVDLGCDFSFVDVDSRNVLQVASKSGNVDIVRKLIDNEMCDTEYRGGQDRASSVLLAAQYGNLKIVELLVKRGCNLAVVDHNKYNILHRACVNHHDDVDMVRYIISLNTVSIDSVESTGMTPVMLASQYGHKRVFDLLVKESCNLRKVNDDQNCVLHLACKYFRVNIVKYLMKRSVIQWMKKMKNKQGRTPSQMGKCTYLDRK